jgi:hypothetical protein
MYIIAHSAHLASPIFPAVRPSVQNHNLSLIVLRFQIP